jgi:hypothetical protein
MEAIEQDPDVPDEAVIECAITVVSLVWPDPATGGKREVRFRADSEDPVSIARTLSQATTQMLNSFVPMRPDDEDGEE